MFNLEVLQDGRQDPEIQGVNGNLSIVSITNHTRRSKDSESEDIMPFIV